MNYKDMIKSIRIKIDDETKSRFQSDEPLRLALNESYRKIYNVLIGNGLSLNKVATTLSFTANNQEVALPKGVRKIIHVQDENDVPIPIYDEALSRSSSTRSVYISKQQASDVRLSPDSTKRADTLGWYIKPTTGFDVIIVYLKDLTLFSDQPDDNDNILDVPEEYHDVIVLYAVVLLLGVDEDNSNFWVSLYQAAQEDMLQSIRQENFDTDEVVDVMGTYYGYY